MIRFNQCDSLLNIGVLLNTASPWCFMVTIVLPSLHRY